MPASLLVRRFHRSFIRDSHGRVAAITHNGNAPHVASGRDASVFTESQGAGTSSDWSGSGCLGTIPRKGSPISRRFWFTVPATDTDPRLRTRGALNALQVTPLLCMVLLISWLTCAVTAEARDVKNRSTDRKTTKHKVVPSKDPKSAAHKIGTHTTKAVKKQRRVKRRPHPKVVQAKAFFCVDVKRNQTVMARNPDTKLPVASLTKLVTALVTLDHMPLDRKLTVPDHIKRVPKSVVGLQAGDRLSVEELLHGLLISSGNDCAETLAHAYPGGKEQFVQAMNKKARSLGATSTTFYTPSGLDRKIAPNGDTKDSEEVQSNVSTARDISRLARVAFANAKIRGICRKKAHVLPSVTNTKGYAVRTTNKLLRDNLPVIGGKTGYTSRAGHCLATELATASKDIFLIVVLGSPDHFGDTRLVYRKALEETRKSRSAVSVVPRGPGRIASDSERFVGVR